MEKELKIKTIYEKISNLRNPVYALENKSAIDVLIHHEDYGDIMFTAAAYDTEEHGRVLWQELTDGIHGVVADFDLELFNQRVREFRINQNTDRYNFLLQMVSNVQTQYLNKKSLSERGLIDPPSAVEQQELIDIEIFSANLLSVRGQLGDEAVHWPDIPLVLQSVMNMRSDDYGN